jgi:hypothetical protein
MNGSEDAKQARQVGCFEDDVGRPIGHDPAGYLSDAHRNLGVARCQPKLMFARQHRGTKRGIFPGRDAERPLETAVQVTLIAKACVVSDF